VFERAGDAYHPAKGAPATLLHAAQVLLVAAVTQGVSVGVPLSVAYVAHVFDALNVDAVPYGERPGALRSAAREIKPDVVGTLERMIQMPKAEYNSMPFPVTWEYGSKSVPGDPEQQHAVDEAGVRVVADHARRSFAIWVTNEILAVEAPPALPIFTSAWHGALLTLCPPAQLRDIACGGRAPIDVADWKAHTAFHRDFLPEHIDAFWRVVEVLFDDDLRRGLLYFATGSPAVPVGGFAALRGSGEACPFTVQPQGPGRLPTSQTCFNTVFVAPTGSADEMYNALADAVQYAGSVLANA
jgi:hypothetical protein